MNAGFKKFCIRIVCFVVLVGLVDWGIGALFVVLKDWGMKRNPESLWLKTSFVVEKVNSDVIVIGSSRASHHYVASMLSDSLGMSVYNCGQDGCFFLYQNSMVNVVLDRYQPKLIIWDIQPSSFKKEARKYEYQNTRFFSPYYSENQWVQPYVDSESSKMKYRMLSNMFAYNARLLNYILPFVVYDTQTQYGYAPMPNEGYHFPEMKDDNSGSVIQNPEGFLQLLGQTIARCQKLGVQLELFISPAFCKKNQATIMIEKAIEDVAGQHGLKCHNYHSAPDFMNHSSYFKDALHLNDNGAKAYTQYVIHDLALKLKNQ